MPYCVASHVVDYLYEIGPIMSGPSPLTHSEIASWQSNTGVELTQWEARAIRMLSVEFIAETNVAKQADAPMPWSDAPYRFTAAMVAAERMKQHMQDMDKM